MTAPYLSFVHCLIISFFTLTSCVSGDDVSDAVLAGRGETLPVVMIHGALASGDTYARHAMLWGSNGYENELLYVFDWNSLGGANAQALAALDAYIDQIRAKTGKNQVYLVGHSAGGGLGYSYCSVAARAQKVRKYVHLASNPQTKPAGPAGEIPTLNVYSKGDKVVSGANMNGAVNAVFEELDHYEVATSPESFRRVYTFLLEEENVIANLIPQDAPKITGRVVTLGENKPMSTVRVRVFETEGATGIRRRIPVAEFTPDTDGRFGPLPVRSDAYHEFEITSDDPEFRTLHYYREPFVRDNPFLYLRTFPPAASFAGIILSNLPKDDCQSVVAVFTANQAVINGRDSLFAGKTELSTPQLCSPTNSTIAMFLYDGGDMKTSGTGHAAFGFVPFLKGADVYNPTSSQETIALTFNGRRLGVRNFKSATEGVIIAVFD
jgi:hypothetical protein